jgi:deoxyribonuclease-4
MLLGAHMSISGGLYKAFLRGKEVGCDTIQIFTKNSNQWKVKDLTEDEITKFKETQKETGINPVVVHDSYLINLGSPEKELLQKSREAFLVELIRCERLGIPYLVMHPGSHVGAGESEGLKQIIDSLNWVIEKAKGYHTKVLLENTAGQGTNLGYRFEHLAEILERVEEKPRFGVCMDTCHTFAAGYDIRTEEGYRKTLEDFDKIIGLNKIKTFHFNDSKKGLNSRVDRHENIGEGCLGLDAFRCFLRDERFKDIPKILETPKDKKNEAESDRKNLNRLRELVT